MEKAGSRIRLRRYRNSCAGFFVMVAWLAHAACASTPSSPSTAPALGTWGGDHVTLTIASAGEHFDFDCARGDIGTPLVLDARGQFSATGTFVREHGGPIRPGETPDSHPASYDGTVTANTMVMTVFLTDLAQTIGTFTLTYGSPGRVVTCLVSAE
jgi:hypothetical protein